MAYSKGVSADRPSRDTRRVVVDGRAYDARAIDTDYVQVLRDGSVIGAFRHDVAQSCERVYAHRGVPVADIRALYTIARSWFALQRDGAASRTTPVAPPKQAPARRRRDVLVVEDDPATRQAIVDVLRDDGCRVYQAADGAQALDLLRAFVPDIIVTDLMMPHVDGWELCERIKSSPALASTPIAVLTAFADVRPIAGVRVIHKPLNVRALTSLLAAIG